MLNVETRPVTWWFALFTGIAAWLLALFCPFLAIRFRVAPVPGDEEDIAVGLLSIYGSPLALAAAAFGAVRSVSFRGKILLALPCASLVLAVRIASVGVSSRP